MKRSDALFVALAGGLFLLFQLVLLFHVQFTDYDEAVFLDVARNIQRSGLPLRSIGPDGVLYFIHTPLYLYLVTASVTLFGENHTLLRLVTTAFSLGTLLLTYATARRTQPALSAGVALLLVAGNGFFALYAYFLTMEAAMTFFIVLAIYGLAVAEEKEAARYWLLAGMAGATAVMLKEIAILFMVAAALHLLLLGQSWRQRLSRLFWLLLPLGGAILLWVLWGFRLDAPAFQHGVAGWFGSALGSGGIVDARSQTAVLTWLSTLSGAVWGWGTAVLFSLSLPAYFLFFRRPLPKILRLLLLYIFLALAASILVRLKEPRHMIATIPALALSIGYLVDWEQLWQWARRRPARLGSLSVLAFLTLWSISPLQLPPRDDWRNPAAWWQPMFSQRIYRSQYYYSLVRETGLYLAQNTPPEAIIAVIHEGPVTGYYADRRHYFLYTMPAPRALQVLAETEYLVIDNFIFPNQTEAEKEQIRAYIDENFQVLQEMQDSRRRITIYQRAAPPG